MRAGASESGQAERRKRTSKLEKRIKAHLDKTIFGGFAIDLFQKEIFSERESRAEISAKPRIYLLKFRLLSGRLSYKGN